MNPVNYFVAFLVALVVSVAVFWVATSVFGLSLFIGGLNVIAIGCFILFLVILFGAPRYNWFRR